MWARAGCSNSKGDVAPPGTDGSKPAYCETPLPSRPESPEDARRVRASRCPWTPAILSLAFSISATDQEILRQLMQEVDRGGNFAECGGHPVPRVLTSNARRRPPSR